MFEQPHAEQQLYEPLVMKAYQYESPATGLQAKELPIPEPRTGEILLAVQAAGLCHSDIHVIRGHGEAWLGKRPITLGHEVAGTVAKLGPGVSQFRVGDRAAVGPSQQPVAIKGFVDSLGLGVDGGYAEYVVASAERLVPLPDEVTFAQAAVSSDSIATAYHAVVGEAGVTPGSSVAILGLGGLGLNGVRVAALKGATVYGVDIDSKKFDSADHQGARACFHSLTKLSGIALDAVVDFAGVGDSTATAITAVKPTGRVVLVGLGADKLEISAQALVIRNVQLRGSLGSIRDEYIAVLDLIATKSIVPVLEEINFTDVPKALERLELGEILGRLWTNPNA